MAPPAVLHNASGSVHFIVLLLIGQILDLSKLRGKVPFGWRHFRASDHNKWLLCHRSYDTRDSHVIANLLQ